MTMRRVFWSMPCVTAVHHLEKGAAIARMPEQAGAATPGQWAIALTVVTAVSAAIAAWAARSGPRRLGVYVALASQLAAGLNVAAFAAVAVRQGGYQPGLLSGIIVVLPFTVYAMARALSEGYASRRGLLGTAAATLALFVSAAAASGQLTQWLTECFGCA